MPQSKGFEAGNGDVEILPGSSLPMTPEAILADFTHYFTRSLGRRTIRQQEPFHFHSVAFTIRDRLMERWSRSHKIVQRSDSRRAYYLSMEFLMGRLMGNALQSLDIEDNTAEAMRSLGLQLEDIREREADTGLGNGGLGRLAACFLDSCATLNLPVMGYGIRYHYGMFHQRIDEGGQVEEPDVWLREGFPWEISRIEHTQTVKFGGRTQAEHEGNGESRHQWIETNDVLAIPYDIPVPGYRNDVVNTLRLWSAAATDEFDLEDFNAGSYVEAVAAKNAAENITMVLYPNAESENGQELRLRQQYFLASASLQDVLRRWCTRHGDFGTFSDKNCFQLNDTHPAIAVPELMRLLMDVHGLPWVDAWDITTRTMAYTNHTLLPEALEQWPVEMFERLLPRLLEIIVEINRRFLALVEQRWPGDEQCQHRMSLISQGDCPMVRMAYLAIVGSFSVNGVAELHSRLLSEGLFRDFSALWPDKFNNKTNGVTQRRWLAGCNPALAALIDRHIGPGWVTDLEQLSGIGPLANHGEFRRQWRDIKQRNKSRLAADVEAHTGIRLDTGMLFDVQVKRIHEYKRQLLNLLHVVHLYDRIRRGDGNALTPRAVIIGGKAAPGYVMAKGIIQCINDVARIINSDPATDQRLRLVFFPNYNVSAMELICPAADLSLEQISTAGKEASGTGNMKLMMNGAVTIGTLDGANVEILEAVGKEHFFLFGHTVEEFEQLRHDYDPAAIVAADEDLQRVVDLLGSGHFRRPREGDKGGGQAAIGEAMSAVIRSIVDRHDPWMTAADFRSFVTAQQQAERAYCDPDHWTRMSIANTAASGRFSTDRTIADYNRDIWRLTPIDLSGE